jgi:hypothetical protein
MQEHYIAAVLKHLKADEREKAERSLQEKFAENPASIRETILLLGHPEECARTFFTTERSLIGSAYIGRYKQALKITIPLLAAVLALSSIIPLFFQPVRITVALLVTKALIATFKAAYHSLFWITLIFIILSKAQVPLPKRRWDAARAAKLLGEEDLTIKRSSMIFDLVFQSLWLVALVFFFANAGWLAIYGRGTPIPLFSDAVRIYVIGWMVLALMNIGLTIYKYFASMWNRPLFFIASSVELIGVIYTTVVITRVDLYHPSFVALLSLGRLTIITRAIGALLIVLTLLEQINNGFSVISGTSPEKRSASTLQ